MARHLAASEGKCGPAARGATRRALLLAAAARVLAGHAAAAPNELVRESAYNYIIVTQDGSLVSFRRMENGARVSAIDLARPAYQVIPYTRYLFAPALINAAPRRVLNIGLGAGSFNRLFTLCYPDAKLTTVEIDPMIVDLAAQFTRFTQSPNDEVVINDGRRYLNRSGARWDWIVIDAFVRNSQYPPHMATHEFFQTVSDHLADKGLLAINVIQGNKLFSCLVATIMIVFPNCLLFAAPDSQNVIVLASRDAATPLRRPLTAPPAALAALMKENGVDLARMAEGASAPRAADCPRPLTDDFSPTEFLGAEWRK